jgi:regulator of RNase E activity RraA/CMP-N-acetylneuraminic acid synthetase
VKTVAFLPAKGSSDRVPNKNIRPFNGEPFFAFTLRKLLACSFIDEVYLDSEDEGILRYGERLGARILRRDPSLSGNDTDGHALFRNEIAHVAADVYVHALCTSPFVRPETIRRAIAALDDHDSAVLVRREKVYEWRNGQPVYGDRIPNSIDLPDRVSEAMGLYVVRGDVARRLGRRVGESPALIEGDPVESIDVNTPEDFFLAERVVAGIVAEESRRLRLLSISLTSAVLSDVCDELGLECVLPGSFASNLPRKVFGRARTMEIREIASGDDDDAIYDALKSYAWLAGNDVVFVRNGTGHAYFGEINMGLAVRSGAQAAIIDGLTRDSGATATGDFPVYSRGLCCRDVKGRGAVASINEPVVVGNVTVCPSDLVFADAEGVMVIPARHEEAVLSRAVEIVSAEQKIIADVVRDIGVRDLVAKHGFF